MADGINLKHSKYLMYFTKVSVLYAVLQYIP